MTHLTKKSAGLSATLLPGIAALFICGIGIARPSYWFDEAASISVALRPLQEQMRVAENIDSVHALYNAVLSIWVGLFGQSELATRSLSLIVFAFAVSGFSLFLLRLRGYAVAIFGSVALVFLPGISWAAGEARGYAFVLACSVWSLVVLERLLRSEGGSKARLLLWISYAVLLFLSFAFSVLSALIFFAHLWLVLTYRRQDTVKFIVAWSVAVVLISPLLMRAAGQSAQVAWIDNSLKVVLSKVVLGQVFWGPRFNDGVSLGLISAVLLMLACFMLVGFTGYSVFKKTHTSETRNIFIFALLLFLAPTILLATVTIIGLPLYQERYLIFAAPGFSLLLALGIEELRTKKIFAILIVTLLIVFSLPQLYESRAQNSKGGDDYRSLAHTAAQSDALVFEDIGARGVAIAYPDMMRGRDLLLKTPPTASGTLWGVNGDLNVDDVKSGSVAVFIAKNGKESVHAQKLQEAGCTSTAADFNTERYKIILLDCLNAFGENGD